MIINVTDKNLGQIKNPALRSYAGMYVSIYKDFMYRVAQTGIEIDPQDTSEQVTQKIEALRELGVTTRNDDKSLLVGEISPACVACQTGVGSATFFVSLQCHRDCYYCFNPNQEQYDYYQDHTRDVVAELAQIKESGQGVHHLALTGGEPLLHKEQAIAFFEYAHAHFPDVYTRLYTCGDHVEAQVLEDLKDAGLQEIRFSIRMHDFARGQRSVFERIALAKDFIPHVMVEMPVLPGTLEEMKEILLELDRLGLYSINLLELCYPLANAEVYREKGFKVKSRPFRVLYDYWYAGGVPIAGSELVCLDLLQFAAEAGLSMGVHYCSVENKQTGQIYQQNSGATTTRTAHFSPRDYFLKTAKVFGEDIQKVKEVFDANGYRTYEINPDHHYLEFQVSKIKTLRKLDIDIGISYNVLETRNGDTVMRELKVDITRPKSFNFSKDV
jgi:pyruvate formate-lyase activating enzyme-like uncharacterized protein